jgi:hypothetical protein
MQPQSKRPKKKNALSFMLLDGARGNARRFQVTSGHVWLVVGLWAAGMLLFAFLGFTFG